MKLDTVDTRVLCVNTFMSIYLSLDNLQSQSIIALVTDSHQYSISSTGSELQCDGNI